MQAILWDDAILDSGFSLIPNLLLDYQNVLDIETEEMCLIMHVLRYKYSSEDPYPRNNTIAGKMNISTTTLGRIIATLKTKGFLEREKVDDWKYSWNFNGLLKALKGAHTKTGAGPQIEVDPTPKEGPAYNNTSNNKTKASKPSPTHAQEAEEIVRAFYEKLNITDETWLQMDIKRCGEFIPEFNEKEIVGMLDLRPNIRTFKYLTLDILKNCYPEHKNKFETSKSTIATNKMLETWDSETPASDQEVKEGIKACLDILSDKKTTSDAPEARDLTIQDEGEMPF